MIINLLLFLIGLLMLYYGADWLVKGSSSLSKGIGLSPIIIGLTVVAFGTSAPELVISIIASLKDKSMIAVGNVVGSNICNIALVLGLAAIFQPIKSSRTVVFRDIPIMLVVSLYLMAISFDSNLGRFDGVTLFIGIILYTCLNYYFALRGKGVGVKEGMDADHDAEEIKYISSRKKQLFFIVLGIAGVAVGAEVLIDSAVHIMEILGVDEKFIGLTIVAFGTSLPELATSVVAAIRKEMDISIGNLVGSNVFNILSVLGAASLVRPIPIQGGFIHSGLIVDYVVMIFTSSLPFFMMQKTFTLTRGRGILLLLCYFGYVTFLLLKTQ
jgi:cation:H+ antiporter